MKTLGAVGFWSLTLLFGAHAEAHRLIASSGKTRVQLVELYSSESCSSCPPADQWVAKFKQRPGLWKSFVPLVFHVDYWNNLGWKDELSSPRMSKRQRDVAQTWSEPSVYTPAVIVDGHEFRRWSSQPLPEDHARAPFTLKVYEETAGEFSVEVEGQRSPSDTYTVHLARLGMGVQSKVTSGENSGRALTHDFVVLAWEAKELKGGETGPLHFTLTAKAPSTVHTAVAAWIESARQPVPLQATGGDL